MIEIAKIVKSGLSYETELFNVDNKKYVHKIGKQFMKIKPIYKTLKGWNSDLTQLESMKDAPSELIEYVEYLESELQVPITVVSVGPDRKQTILR